MNRIKRSAMRSPSGSMPALAMIGMVPVMMAIGAFAIDMMHLNIVKGELVKACDAGSLAGAKEFYQWNGGAGQPIVLTRAETVTSLNWADARQVANTTANTTVTPTIVTAPTSPNGAGGVVRVEASMVTGNLWAQVFAQAQQTLNASSDASCTGIGTMNSGGTYPIAVKVDAAGPDGTALNTHTIGDAFQLGGWNGPNAAWCGWGAYASNPPGAGALQGDYGVGNITDVPTAKDISTPGTVLDVASGVQASLFGDVSSRTGQVLVMPVITTTSNEVISFMCFRVNSVTGSGAGTVVNVTLVAGPASGTGSHQPNAGANNAWISNNEPTRVRLVQ